MVIYFTADNRIDFRDLVKDPASTFHTRIELRQIGSRDECKMLGGIAPCGRACCCSDHISEFAHVSIKMAKTQHMPKLGSFVKTQKDGSGIADSINQLKDTVTVKKEKKDGGVEFVEVPASEITFSAKKAPAADEKVDEEAQKSE